MTLYLKHFGLREAPFKITPTAEFFYHGGRRGDILHALLYAVKMGEGIMMVTGEVGSGKTMMLRTMAERLPGEADLIYIANPSLSGREILFHICEELELKTSDDRHDTVRRLQNYLVERHAEGRRVVAFIDEAQAMPDESLEEIRLLSNLETSREKLLQIVLFGQPELDEKLSQHSMRQLRERITVHFRLDPLTRADVREYIATRLRAAGHEGGPLFTDEASNVIYGVSQGLSRRVNVLADKSLLSAYERGALAVSAADAKRAAEDVQFVRMRQRSRGARKIVRRLAFGFAAAAAALLILAAGVRWVQSDQFSAVRDSVAAQAELIRNPQAEPVPPGPPDENVTLDSVAAVNAESDSDSKSESESEFDSGPVLNPNGLGSDVSAESLLAEYGAIDHPESDAEAEMESESGPSGPSEISESGSGSGPAAVGVGGVGGVVTVTAPAPAPIVVTVVAERILERVTVVRERITVDRIAPEAPPPRADPLRTRREMLDVIRGGEGGVSGESLARELQSVAESHEDAPRETGAGPATWDAAAARQGGGRGRDGVGDNQKWGWMPAGSYLRGRLNATETWLRERTPPGDRRHTARLLTVGRERAVFLERLLRHLADFYPIRNLMVYPARLRSGDKFVVTFGVYPSRDEADIYIANLPYYFTGGRPFAQPLAESAREAEGLW